MRILAFGGLGLALIGAGLLTAPRWTASLLRLLGVRRPLDTANRAAAWGLVVIGLLVVILARLIR
ncbi:MAG: hypothetical protein E6J14_01695 [Chloroflexi bacterium]|nr:MAG: hypothetical protein E6J14_01695 [Chloroflexota bacterium]